MSHIHFEQFQSEFFRHYQAGDFSGAMQLIKLFGGLFPERASAVYNWRMCLAARLNETEEAIRIFQEALDLGLWWPEHLLHDDDDLAALQGRPDFEAMVVTCKERHAQAQATAQPEMLVWTPEGPAQPPYPLLLAMHGRNGNGRETLNLWQDLSRLGWLVASVQSSQVVGSDLYVWDDEQRAVADILSMMVELRKQHPIDSERTVLAGFSQGAGLAMRLALKGLLPARGFIGVAPYLPNFDNLPQTPEAAAPVRGYLVTGGRDPAQDLFARFETYLHSISVPYLRDHYPDAGHDYPPGIFASQQKALEFILA